MAFAISLTACGGAGPYGFAVEYVPLAEEEEFLETATEAPYEDVRRDPAAYRTRVIGWFGVVTGIEPGEGGTTLVHLTHRIHQPRHLCADERARSCRVTVSERASGPWTAVLTLRPEEREGRDRLYTGSLVKVYGTTTGDFDADGGPVLAARWHRHWPRGTFVTTADRSRMRR
jgi:hypothetical protein